MHLPSTWPEALIRHLREAYGEADAVEPLGGMSGALVYRVRFMSASAIVKGRAQPGEARFYEMAAPIVRAHGVAVPRLEWLGPEARWLVLEDIPRPFPRERWGADPRLLEVLHRIHAIPAAALPPLPGMFRPGWTDEMSEAALSCFSAQVASRLRPLLAALRAAYAHLFEPVCCISGDPNPTNWGLRDDGRLVLFDWERFGYGAPALDLAIAIPGLGDTDAFEMVACRYLGQPQAADWHVAAVEQLAREVGAAKIWSAVEFLSMYAGGATAAGAATAEWLVQRFPAWLGGLNGVVVKG